MTKIYLITYTPGLYFNREVFHKYITSLYPRHISDWWHYIDTTYLVASSLNPNQLYSLIFPGVPGRYLFIIEVDPNVAQGWLPNEAWTWLQKYQRKPGRV